ncbi:uncharacterized protein sparcl2 [Nelusetta ayraudi]|uniref:uncharacterized protein sparcl2 n=1 Tax=Nelusetta ayraudi TaxID=303726 RepID=UPI003F6E82C5
MCRPVEFLLYDTDNRERAPECSISTRTDGKERLLHQEKGRRRRSTGQARRGANLVTRVRCTEKELGQFSYDLLDSFLFHNRMVDGYVPGALPLQCLSHSQRTQLAQQWFGKLDLNSDGKLTRMELRKLHDKRMPMKHCASKFFRSCDQNKNKDVTLQEWEACMVRRTEDWFHEVMSMKMGSPQMCPADREP